MSLSLCLYQNFRDTRYVLLMTENYAALRVLEKTFPNEYANASVIFGSSFPKDQEFAQVRMLLSMKLYKEEATMASVAGGLRRYL